MSLYTLTKQIKKSIKDKENLLSFNQWSATEYKNDLSSFNAYGSPSVINSSKNYSTIGDQCIYFTINSDHWWFGLLIDSLPNIGNYTFSCDIFSNNRVLVRIYDSNDNIVSSVNASVGKTTISLSGQLENINDNYIRFLLYGEGVEAYIDNLQLTPQ